MSDMPVGGLTAPSNTTVVHRRYVGSFGQPDGFGGMLRVRVNADGRLELTTWYRDINGVTKYASIGLTNEQRRDLATQLGAYNPCKMEDIVADV